MNLNYRNRIYGKYTSSWGGAFAPNTLAELTPRAPYLRRLVRTHFPVNKEANILELGCGYGALIHFAREQGYQNIYGVDGSVEQVQVARKLGINGISQHDLREVLAGQENNSLDMVIAFDVIEHFTREELVPFVDQVLRVLKPGGRWIIHVPNGESPFSGRMRYWDLTHELAFTHLSLGQLLLSSGFSEIKCYEDEPVVHGIKSGVRWLLWKIFRNILRLYIAAETGDASNRHIFSQNLLAVATK